MASSADVWPCPKCTFHNSRDAIQCEVCLENNPCKSKSQIASSISALPSQVLPSYNNHNNAHNNNHNNNHNINDKSEQDDDDDDDVFLDMTQYDDSHKNHANNHNSNNNKREKTPLKTYPTEISLESTEDNDDDYQPDYDDYSDNDQAYKNVLETSRIEAKKQAENQENHRRMSEKFGSEQNQIKIATQLSMQDGNNSNNSSLFGDHSHLFANFSSNTNNTNNTNNKNTTDANDIDMNDMNDMPDISSRKRKRNIENDIESPPKKRVCYCQKIDDEKKAKKRRKKKKKKEENIDEKLELDDEFTVMNLNDSNDLYEPVDPDTLSKKQRERIECGYQRFLTYYLKGAYCLMTVCIEYGPKFKGRSAEFTKILSDTQWRPKSLTIPRTTAFESIDNMSLPDNVCRFKHYTLNTRNKLLIFAGCNNEEEMKKLERYTKEGLGEYFLPRLINKNKCIYSSYVMIRLNWKDFKKVWNEKRFMTLIEEVRGLDNVEIINICLENVAQKITSIQNKNQQVGNVYDDSSPFADEQELKNRMINYYFEDKLLHFSYKRNPKESAEHIIRVARAIADDRFKKIRVNQLTISDHTTKGVRDKKKSDKDVFWLTLVPMHNLSEKKASGITNKYPTIGALMRAYKRMNENDGEMLLADVRPTLSSARIGPAISKRVYHAFYKNTDGDRKMNA